MRNRSAPVLWLEIVFVLLIASLVVLFFKNDKNYEVNESILATDRRLFPACIYTRYPFFDH